MDEIIFGSVLLIAGVISLLTARRAFSKGASRLRSIAPNSEHTTILKVGSMFRWLFTLTCFAVGIGMIVFGLVKQN